MKNRITSFPLALLTAGALAQAQTAAPPSKTLPMSATVGFETLRLPAGEDLGLVGGSLLFEVADAWWAGPAVYGAATGQRGGLFVGGLEVQRRWALADRWQLVTGLYAGGGGVGNAPVGGGLMLRPAVSLLRDFGGVRAGLSASHVRFPSGDIRSSQFGLLLSWDGTYRYVDAAYAGQRVDEPQRSGLGFDQWLATIGEYHLRDGSGRNIGLVGARVQRHDESGAWYWGMEAAAAARGGAAGYMELLGSAGWEYPVLPSLRVGARGALGLGGGGGVPSGGGVIGKASATLAWAFAPGWQAGLEGGVLDGTHGKPRARTAQLWLAAELEPSRTPGSATGQITRFDWTASLQHVLHADRKDGSRGSLETVGIKLDRSLSDTLYLSAQAHSAYAGGAGAYSVGLVGAGLATPSASGGWRFGAELLAGAAGGGGVATGGGAIAQALAWAGLPTGPHSQVRMGIGHVRSLRNGGLSSPLLELSWSQAFGLSGR
jgi:hypothetical protein